eukprot:1478389-Amphidinium_carterae.1
MEAAPCAVCSSEGIARCSRCQGDMHPLSRKTLIPTLLLWTWGRSVETPQTPKSPKSERMEK